MVVNLVPLNTGSHVTSQFLKDSETVVEHILELRTGFFKWLVALSSSDPPAPEPLP